MATITKRVERAVEPGKRYQLFKSSGNNDSGSTIAEGDIFMIQDSLGRPAKSVQIKADAYISNLSIRLNSQILQFKTRQFNPNDPVVLDLENPINTTDSSMEPLEIGAGETLTLSNLIPISDIQIVSLDAGSFELFVA